MVMGLEVGFCVSQLDVGIILHAALSSCPEVRDGEETAHHKPYHSEPGGTFCSRLPATPVTWALFHVLAIHSVSDGARPTVIDGTDETAQASQRIQQITMACLLCAKLCGRHSGIVKDGQTLIMSSRCFSLQKTLRRFLKKKKKQLENRVTI